MGIQPPIAPPSMDPPPQPVQGGVQSTTFLDVIQKNGDRWFQLKDTAPDKAKEVADSWFDQKVATQPAYQALAQQGDQGKLDEVRNQFYDTYDIPGRPNALQKLGTQAGQAWQGAQKAEDQFRQQHPVISQAANIGNGTALEPFKQEFGNAFLAGTPEANGMGPQRPQQQDWMEQAQRSAGQIGGGLAGNVAAAGLPALIPGVGGMLAPVGAGAYGGLQEFNREKIAGQQPSMDHVAAAAIMNAVLPMLGGEAAGPLAQRLRQGAAQGVPFSLGTTINQAMADKKNVDFTNPETLKQTAGDIAMSAILAAIHGHAPMEGHASTGRVAKETPIGMGGLNHDLPSSRLAENQGRYASAPNMTDAGRGLVPQGYAGNPLSGHVEYSPSLADRLRGMLEMGRKQKRASANPSAPPEVKAQTQAEAEQEMKAAIQKAAQEIMDTPDKRRSNQISQLKGIDNAYEKRRLYNANAERTMLEEHAKVLLDEVDRLQAEVKANKTADTQQTKENRVQRKLQESKEKAIIKGNIERNIVKPLDKKSLQFKQEQLDKTFGATEEEPTREKTQNANNENGRKQPQRQKSGSKNAETDEAKSPKQSKKTLKGFVESPQETHVKHQTLDEVLADPEAQAAFDALPNASKKVLRSADKALEAGVRLDVLGYKAKGGELALTSGEKGLFTVPNEDKFITPVGISYNPNTEKFYLHAYNNNYEFRPQYLIPSEKGAPGITSVSVNNTPGLVGKYSPAGHTPGTHVDVNQFIGHIFEKVNATKLAKLVAEGGRGNSETKALIIDSLKGIGEDRHEVYNYVQRVFSDKGLLRNAARELMPENLRSLLEKKEQTPTDLAAIDAEIAKLSKGKEKAMQAAINCVRGL